MWKVKRCAPNEGMQSIKLWFANRNRRNIRFLPYEHCTLPLPLPLLLLTVFVHVGNGQIYHQTIPFPFIWTLHYLLLVLNNDYAVQNYDNALTFHSSWARKTHFLIAARLVWSNDRILINLLVLIPIGQCWTWSFSVQMAFSR